MTLSRTLALSLGICLLSGCTRIVSESVATFSPGAMPTTQPVPTTAAYFISFVDEKGKKFGGVPGSERLLQAGEHAGFEIDESGSVIAIAAKEKFPIDVPPGQTVVWLARYRKPTQFSKEVAKATVAASKTAAVGAGLFARGLLKLDDNDDDNSPPAPAV